MDEELYNLIVALLTIAVRLALLAVEVWIVVAVGSCAMASLA